MPDMNTLASAVLNIKDLVSYQTGSVVSRTLIDKSVGTVTVFAFDHGQGLSEHTAPFDALVQIIDGTADITIDGSTYRQRRRDDHNARPNRPHSLKANPQFKMLSAHDQKMILIVPALQRGNDQTRPSRPAPLACPSVLPAPPARRRKNATRCWYGSPRRASGQPDTAPGRPAALPRLRIPGNRTQTAQTIPSPKEPNQP